MTLQEQISALLNMINAVNEENQTLRKHMDALILMQSKALAPQLGLEVKFTKEEIAHIESVASVRLFSSNLEEFEHGDYVLAEIIEIEEVDEPVEDKESNS